MPDILSMIALKKNLMAKCNPKYLVPPDLTFTIEYPTDQKIVDAVKKDPLLQNKMYDAARKIYDSLERQMGMALTGYEKKIEEAKGDKKAAEKAAKDFQDLFKSQVDLAKGAAVRDVEKVWTDLTKTKKEYMKYRFKAGGKIALGVAGIAASIGTTVASFGASSVLSIAGMVKSAGQIAQQTYDLYIELEKVQKDLNSTLAEVAAAYKDASKGSVAAQETAALFVEKILVVRMPSIRECERLVDLGESKLKGVVVKGHEIATKLNRALSECDKLAPKLDQKSAAKLGKAEGRIHELIRKVGDQLPRAEKGSAALAESKSVVSGLKAKSPSAMKYIEKGMLLIDIGFLATGWEDIVQGASSVAADLAVDKIIDRAMG